MIVAGYLPIRWRTEAILYRDTFFTYIRDDNSVTSSIGKRVQVYMRASESVRVIADIIGQRPTSSSEHIYSAKWADVDNVDKQL